MIRHPLRRRALRPAAAARCGRTTAAALAAALLILPTIGAAPPALAGGPVYWDWPAGRAFTELELAGAALDAAGAVVPGFALQEGVVIPEEVVWTVVPDGKGGWYSGTGHEGRIYHTAAGGKTTLLADLQDAEVFCLLLRRDGGLVAGCGPQGQVYAVTADGQSRLLGSVPGGYVWGMAEDPDSGEVWLVGGSPAIVCRVAADGGEVRQVAVLPAQNAMDIAWDPGRGWLAATQGPGLVVRLPQEDPASPVVLLQTEQDEARQLTVDPQGGLAVLALSGGPEPDQRLGATADADPEQGGDGDRPRRPLPRAPTLFFDEDAEPRIPRAAIYGLGADGGVRTIWSGDLDLMIVAWDADLGWLGAGSLDAQSGLSVLYRLLEGAGVAVAARWEGGDVLDLKVVPARGGPVVLAAQAHPGRVDVLAGPRQAAQRTALSPPLDGGRPLRWGRLSWTGDGPAGQVRWSVRGGNSSRPDGGWTPWSSSWTGVDQAIALPACRFLQWRAELPPAAADGPGARIVGVSVSAWRDNQAPVVTAFAREHLKEVFLGGLMTRGENITRSFRSGLKAEFSRDRQGPPQAPEGRAALGRGVEVFTWAAEDPDGDRLRYDLHYRPLAGGPWRTAEADLEDLLGTWDTSALPDGDYEVRLGVSDLPDNPEPAALEVFRTLGPIRVDNTPPAISDLKVARRGGSLRLDFRCQDGASALAAARVVLPDGSSRRLDPVDAICDSPQESFAADVPWLGPAADAEAGGPQADRWVRVEVTDLAGNVATAEGRIP